MDMKEISIVAILLVIMGCLIQKNKHFIKFFKKRARNKVILNLINQGIVGLEENIDEEEIIIKVRKHYENNFDYKTLKLMMIKLENCRLEESKFAILNFNGILVSFLLTFIALLISLSSKKVFDINFIICLAIFSLAFIGIGSFYDLISESKNIRLDIAINIHKSIIEEQLKKIQGEQKQKINENEDIGQDIKNIKKFLGMR